MEGFPFSPQCKSTLLIYLYLRNPQDSDHTYPANIATGHVKWLNLKNGLLLIFVCASLDLIYTLELKTKKLSGVYYNQKSPLSDILPGFWSAVLRNMQIWKHSPPPFCFPKHINTSDCFIMSAGFCNMLHFLQNVTNLKEQAHKGSGDRDTKHLYLDLLRSLHRSHFDGKPH